MKKIRLFTPGPCAVPEDVLIEMARPFEHHRTPWFKDLMKQCQTKLQEVLQTKNEVLIITGSGTAAAEGVIIGCNPLGSKMLTITAPTTRQIMPTHHGIFIPVSLDSGCPSRHSRASG